MKKVWILFVLLISSAVFGINPNEPYVQPSLTDMNAMGRFLVQEWAFGSIDAAFLVLSMVTVGVLLKFGTPMSTITLGVVGLAVVFAFGFNSLLAWGILILGIVLVSLLFVINLLLKTQY